MDTSFWRLLEMQETIRDFRDIKRFVGDCYRDIGRRLLNINLETKRLLKTAKTQ